MHLGGNNLDNDFGSNPLATIIATLNNCKMVQQLTILKMLTLLIRRGVQKESERFTVKTTARGGVTGLGLFPKFYQLFFGGFPNVDNDV